MSLWNTLVSSSFLKEPAAHLQVHSQKRLEPSFWDHDPDDKWYHKNPQCEKHPLTVTELLYKSLPSLYYKDVPNTENSNQNQPRTSYRIKFYPEKENATD